MTHQRRQPGQTRQAVYEYVRQCVLAGQPPSVREVQATFGFRAVQTAQEHLEALVAEGRLVKAAGKARAYRLPESEGEPTVYVPLLGLVRAGVLSEAVEDREGLVPVALRRPGSLRADDPAILFALRIKGDSMVGAGILEGDLVIVRRQAMAQTGDIVVALVGDETTVKRLYRARGRLELRPENPAYAPIVVAEPDEVRLLGKVIEVRRYLDEVR